MPKTKYMRIKDAVLNGIRNANNWKQDDRKSWVKLSRRKCK